MQSGQYIFIRSYIVVAIPSNSSSLHNTNTINRTAFTILSNLGVFVAMWVLLNVVGDRKKQISYHDEWIFSVRVAYFSCTCRLQCYFCSSFYMLYIAKLYSF